MQNVLALIPARGGSKGIPRKNIAPVAGKPLLWYTCQAALQSHFLTRIVLSTDDKEIAEVGKALGVEAPFLRPPDLAQDDTPSLSVAQHALHWLQEQQMWQADALVLLQPTSPLRRAHHIDEALNMMENEKADTVVSVVSVPHRFNPYSLMALQDGCLCDFRQEPVAFDRYRRQDTPVLYARNGPAILASRAGVILESHSFYGSRVIPYVMKEEESLDIDTPFDLRLAECLLAGPVEAK